MKTIIKRILNKISVRTLTCVTVIAMLMPLSGCGLSDGISLNANNNDKSGVEFAYKALLYNNTGENFVSFTGNRFDITPNKVKQYGYNSEGSYTSWYETSSVVTITIDGHKMDTCGSTVIFKDVNLKIEPLDENIDTSDDFAIVNWYRNSIESRHNYNQLVLIQSQDGYNIGVVAGNNITWEVAEKLPKTTLISIDGKPLYVHRCNFSVIDTAMFNQIADPE